MEVTWKLQLWDPCSGVDYHACTAVSHPAGVPAWLSVYQNTSSFIYTVFERFPICAYVAQRLWLSSSADALTAAHCISKMGVQLTIRRVLITSILLGTNQLVKNLCIPDYNQSCQLFCPDHNTKSADRTCRSSNSAHRSDQTLQHHTAVVCTPVFWWHVSSNKQAAPS